MQGQGEGGLLPPSPGPPRTLHCPLSPRGTIILLGTCEQPFFPPGGGMSPTIRPPPLPSLASRPGQGCEAGTGRLGRWQLPSCWDGAAPRLLCPGGAWPPPAPGDTSACLPHPPGPGQTPRHRAVHLHPDSGGAPLGEPLLGRRRGAGVEGLALPSPSFPCGSDGGGRSHPNALALHFPLPSLPSLPTW